MSFPRHVGYPICGLRFDPEEDSEGTLGLAAEEGSIAEVLVDLISKLSDIVRVSNSPDPRNLPASKRGSIGGYGACCPLAETDMRFWLIHWRTRSGFCGCWPDMLMWKEEEG